MANKKKAAKKKNKFVMDIKLADMGNIVQNHIDAVKPVDDKTWKIEQKMYDKFYKLGKKYAREFNNMAIAKRKQNVHNVHEEIGWTDGFVDAALTNLYNNIDTTGYDHYEGATLIDDIAGKRNSNG